MSSKGYIKIPETQLLLERKRRLANRTWHRNVMNLLLGKNVCGSCLRLEEDLVHWDAEFVWLRYKYDIDSSLKNIMMSTFGPSLMSIIPTTNFCQKCVDTILSAHLFIAELRNNCNQLQRTLTDMSQQMKWTNYLDETGSLMESLNNRLDLNDNSEIATNNDKTQNKDENNVKTHKIVLNDESLKFKLLQEPNMHKYLFREEKIEERELPAGITVRKVRKSVDMSDFTPHDLLELNWDEDDTMAMTPQKHDLSSKLHSNETLIMNLMEQAKTIEKHIHFHENLELQAKDFAPDANVVQNLNDSLSVKLVQNNVAKENSSDNEDLVPQDLLELKWPEEQSADAKHYTKIPVKKLNFNENLTVKFIPSHKLCKVTDRVDEPAPQELLELNWKDEENTNLPTDHTDHKPSIDLTQWLHDQGMSTIKTKVYTHNNKRIRSFNVLTSKKIKLENNSKEISNIIVNKTPLPSGTAHDTSKSKTVEDLLNFNVIVKNARTGTENDLTTELDNNVIRCALCNLSFIQFESYSSHYKTHKITESAKCYRCSANFAVIELLVEHLLLMHSEDMAYCTLCYALLSQDRVAKHMVDYHAKRVEIINAGSAAQRLDEYCKKCHRIMVKSNSPHICGSLECTECIKDCCIHEKYLISYRDQLRANAPVLKCVDCVFEYKTLRDIIRHANLAHLKRETQKCEFCDARFALITDLANHTDTNHARCKSCKKVFPDKINLDTHNCPKTYAVTSVTNKLNCEMCGEKFIGLKWYMQHKQTALAVKDKCVVCNCLIRNKCNMARHILLFHHLHLKTEKSTSNIVFECTKCEADIKNGNEYTQHVCIYECRRCSSKFRNKTLYENHLKAHLNVSEFSNCTICGLEWTDKISFAKHMRTCHGNYEKCPVCLNYIEKRKLRKHIEHHGNEQETLKCPHCPLVCENQNQYEVHVNRFHLLNRPYECDICEKRFYSKNRLREHIRLHSSQARRQKCTLCSKKFATKTTLNKHMKLHATGQLYNCDLCEKRYISAVLLDEHRKSHRNNSLSMPETSQNSGYVAN